MYVLYILYVHASVLATLRGIRSAPTCPYRLRVGCGRRSMDEDAHSHLGGSAAAWPQPAIWTDHTVAFGEIARPTSNARVFYSEPAMYW